MPSSQQAAPERRNDRTLSPHTVAHEPPKLKTTLKTPPKQATNPLQFVKVGPCSLYRTAQEQLQKVQEVKKIKQEIRDDPEDWQSNLDNWKSSRRKRQEHIIERVVEVKKLELEEHDRQRRRSKTFSEMMEERGNRGRKLSISLAMYNEEDANDLSDLGIGTSSGKSSISGDTHDDTHSVLSDRDSEIDKNNSDVDNTGNENGNDSNDNGAVGESTTTTSSASSTTSVNPPTTTTTPAVAPLKKEVLNNGFHNNGTSNSNHNGQEYDSATTATASSPEPEEYTYESAIRGYVSRVSQNIPRRSLPELDAKLDNAAKKPAPTTLASINDKANGQEKSNGVVPAVKVDILKRREIFEKASRENVEKQNANNNNNNNNRLDFASTKSIKERLSILERQKSENEAAEKVSKSPRHSVDSNISLRERFNREKLSSEKEPKTRDLVAEELEGVKPLRERLSNLEKFTSNDQGFTPPAQRNGDLSTERLNSLENNRCKESEKRTTNYFHEQANNRAENSTPSERSSSPDSEYRAPRATFHQSLDSLDADASSGPDTFERVQSLEELDYHQTRRYPASSSSAEILNDTDREDSGIHTADASCSVSQADEPIEEENHEKQQLLQQQQQQPQQPVIVEEKTEFRTTIETTLVETSMNLERVEEKIAGLTIEPEPRDAVLTETGTADISSSSSTSTTSGDALSANSSKVEPPRTTTNANTIFRLSPSSSSRPVVYQSPPVPPRRSPPDSSPKSKLPSYLPGLTTIELTSPKDESPSESLSTPDSSSTNTICSLNLSIEPLSSPGSASPYHGESKPQTPLASPRSPSKIPTPLPRKSIASPTSSSSCSLTSPLSSCPSSPKIPPPVSPKPRSPRIQQQPSEIPIPVKVTSPVGCGPRTTTTTTPAVSDEEAARRRTVVEVCEKVVVPSGGRAVCTPFITLERYEAGNSTEAEQQQQPEPVAEKKEEDKQQLKQELAMESVLLVQEIMVSQKEKELPPPAPVRPTTLALERTTLCSDFLSPLSPVSKQILPLSFSSDEEIVTGLSFPLGPPTSVEPPKEKPPPPPVDLSDEENHPIEPLKRLNSTRRIKKEIRSRRSDFLGIEGFNDDELVERELTLTKPPDMAAILAEERRIEQLHRRSYDTDSNYEQDSSHERDSGVELGQAEDWTKQPVSPDMSQHSRQSSEPFGASVTSSEEDEISKKEREIIEVLEREEQWRYENNREINSDIGEKLAHKLRELEEEKMQLERERASQEANDNQQQRRRIQEPTAETLRMNEENLRKQEELTRKQDEAARQQQQMEMEKQQRAEEKRQEEEARMQEQMRMQEERDRRNTEARRQEEMQIRATEKNMQEKPMSPALSTSTEDEYASRDVLRVERELLQLEQEELKRQRSNLAYREQKQQQLAEQLQEQWKSLQDVAQTGPATPPRQPYGVKPQQQAPLNYRSSMPNLQMQVDSMALGQRRRPPPPPIPPAKPLRLVEQRQRDVTIRNSRIPSADSIPQQVETPLRPSCSTTALSQQQHQNQHGQQMTRQTLQALSAVPRPRIVQADQWVQRRKSDIPRGAHDYNYQHWLIQEAEQRRINEKNQRSPPTRKPHVTGTSVPYTASPARHHDNKPLPDSIIQTLTQRVQNRVQEKPLSPRRRLEHSVSQEHLHSPQQYQMQQHKVHQSPNNNESQEKMLSVSGKKKCSHCGDELGRGAAMIIESLRLFYHMECFKCCVCHVRLGDGLMGTDVRVRNHKLHCHNCYSSDDGVKFSCV